MPLQDVGKMCMNHWQFIKTAKIQAVKLTNYIFVPGVYRLAFKTCAGVIT